MSKLSKIVIPLAALILLVALVLPVASIHQAEAFTYPDHVWVAPPPLGIDAIDRGTEAAPFATIGYGIEHVAYDGTVHVAAGTYHENLQISGAVNLMGAGAPDTIINGNGLTSVIKIGSAPDTPNTISGFTIQNGYAISSLWNPANEHILYAGIKLPPAKLLPQLFSLYIGGGGLYIGETHNVTINDCIINDNQAEVGGGIWNQGRLYMNRCTVSNNAAIYYGGGIYNTTGVVGGSGQMWLTNCTISGNSLMYDGDSYGAGIYQAGGAPGPATMELLNCTVAYNYTTVNSNAYGGGFAENVPATSIFKNTIVADNTAGNTMYNNGYIEPYVENTSKGHNLDGEKSCGFNQSTDLANTNPWLGPLQDNGGPTPTHALLDVSPAVDAGTCSGAPDTDQRGITRPQGLTCDIGAYELIPTIEPPAIKIHPDSAPSTPNTNRNLDPPQMSVQYLSVNPKQATASQPVTISTNVVNTGDQGGNLNITLKINGQVEQTRMIAVGPKASQPVKFTVTKNEPGTYTVDILDQNSSFIVLDKSNAARTPVNNGLINFLIIAALLIATVAALILSRRPA
jgi:hypothetical protein